MLVFSVIATMSCTSKTQSRHSYMDPMYLEICVSQYICKSKTLHCVFECNLEDTGGDKQQACNPNKSMKMQRDICQTPVVSQTG